MTILELIVKLQSTRDDSKKVECKSFPSYNGEQGEIADIEIDGNTVYICYYTDPYPNE